MLTQCMRLGLGRKIRRHSMARESIGFLLVFLGGGLGSMCRYGLGLFAKTYLKWGSFPVGTFLANLLGCFVIGLVVAWLSKHQQLNSYAYLLFATGFCGGFTTFSSFALENQSLLKSGDYLVFLLYFLSTCVLGILALVLGMAWVRWLG